ncbi:MAG: glycosyltransferase family 39 protein [Chitinophagales bacterium]|nr:glycosyltransferase family 39 protein [Chitinophagales bacterium]MDW8272736.1 glycosyltransferase family 39 protein [Chitinophagales bacterium]
MKHLRENFPTWVFALVALLHFSYLRLDIPEVDAAQLAEISRELMLSSNWWELKFLGEPYLDKPHLLFWLSALSMKIFGVGDWSYRFPSFLFGWLGVYSVYRFALLYYHKQVARTAALIAASFFYAYIATYDVRADTVLAGSVMFACWNLAAFIAQNSAYRAVLSGLGLALAFSAKGPIGLVAPMFVFLPAFFSLNLYRRKLLFRIPLLLLFFALGSFPVLYAHYKQFGWEGLRFFLWKQSFGRVTGESGWSNNPDPFFVIHTTAWALLPYTAYVTTGLFKGIISFVKGAGREQYSLCGLVFTLGALSLSKYQLPHYFYVAYPLAAVVAAPSFFYDSGNQRWINIINISLNGAFLIISLVMVMYIFPQTLMVKLFCISCAVISIYLLLSKFPFKWSLILHFILLQGILSCCFFPELLNYQSNSAIGKHLKGAGVKQNQYTVYNNWRVYSLSYVSQTIPYITNVDEQLALRCSQKPHYVICFEEDIQKIEKICGQPSEKLLFLHYPITQLSLSFLLPHSRPAVVKKAAIVKY